MIELARHSSAHGAIRVLERPDGLREYWQGEALHTLACADGESRFGHIQAMAHLMRHARTALVLGGAGASLATMSARRGADVTVVEIEPRAQELAAAHFGLDHRVRWILADAAHFVRETQHRFDVIAVDVFSARGDAPAHDTAEKIEAIARLLSPHGLLLANFAELDGPPAGAWPIACALAERNWATALLKAEASDEGNEILVLSAKSLPPLDNLAPPHAPEETHLYLSSLQARLAPDAPP